MPQFRIVFILVAVGFAAFGAWLAWRRVAVVLSGGRAQGLVVEHDRREIDDSVGYHPVVSFLDHAQVRRRFTSGAGWSTPLPKVGTQVPVRYLHRDPRVAYIATFLHLWAGPVALFALALGALAVAFGG